MAGPAIKKERAVPKPMKARRGRSELHGPCCHCLATGARAESLFLSTVSRPKLQPAIRPAAALMLYGVGSEVISYRFCPLRGKADAGIS